MLFSAALIVYCLTRTHLNTFDAVAYANQIGLAEETGKLRPLFHPHHLLFNALGYLWWRIAQSLGYEGGSLATTQEMNAALGAAGLVLYHATLRRLHRAGALPLVMTLCLAGSFGYWICATDGRVNMPSIVLMMAAFHTLICFQETPTARLAAVIGGLAGAAVLFHESAGLFGLVGAAGVFPASVRNRRLITAYAASWSAAVAVPYLLVGVFALHFYSLAAFHHWAGAYAERGWWWDFHIGRNLRLDLFRIAPCRFCRAAGPGGADADFFAAARLGRSHRLVGTVSGGPGRTAGGWPTACCHSAAPVALFRPASRRRLPALDRRVRAFFLRSGVRERLSSGFRH